MTNIIIDTIMQAAKWPVSVVRLTKPDTDRVGAVLWISYDAWITTVDPKAPKGVTLTGLSRPADLYIKIDQRHTEVEWEQIMSEAGWYLGAGYMYRWWHSPRAMPHLFGMERYVIGEDESAIGVADDVLNEMAIQFGCWEWEINSAWRREDVLSRWRQEDATRGDDGRRVTPFPGWDDSHPWMRNPDGEQMDYESHYYYVAPPSYQQNADVLVKDLITRITTMEEMTVDTAVVFAAGSISERGIRKACESGYIPGARKVGRDWLIPREGFNHYLDNRPLRGPKTRKGLQG